MLVIETERLNLRWLGESDAAFILDLLNQPSWLEFIGDRGVRDLDDARMYIDYGRASLEKNGFGLYLVEIKATQSAIGLCGFLKRETLAEVDIGFAFHPDAWGKGYAREAAHGCLAFARDQLHLERLVAITLPGNPSSIKLLCDIGMQFDKEICLGDSVEVLHLFTKTLC